MIYDLEMCQWHGFLMGVQGYVFTDCNMLRYIPGFRETIMIRAWISMVATSSNSIVYSTFPLAFPV